MRLAVAAGTGLSPDEAYYRVWSHALAAGYLDHPPMVALLIRAGVAVAGETPLGVRLAAPVLTAGGSLLLAAAGRDLLGLSAAGGLLAALVFNATLMIGVGSIVMTPDTPVVLFWGLTLFLLGRALRTGHSGWVAAAGAALGLGFCSKYTAVLLAPAIGIWLLATPRTRALARRPGTAAGVVAGLVAVSPVLWWNARHHFASFAKQGGRTEVLHLARAPRYLSELVFGQFGLLTPLIAVAAVAGTVTVVRRALRGEPGPILVALATLVPAAVFLLHAVGDRVQANWPCVLYPTLVLSAAAWFQRGSTPAEARPAGGARTVRGPGAALWLGFAVTLVVYVQALFHPFALPPRADVTGQRLTGWGTLAADIRRLDAPLGLPVVSTEYGLASELAWNDAGPRVVAVAPRWSLFRLPRGLVSDDGPVLLVSRIRRDGAVSAPGWRIVRVLATVDRRAGGEVFERYEAMVARPPDPLPPSARLPLRPWGAGEADGGR